MTPPTSPGGEIALCGALRSLGRASRRWILAPVVRGGAAGVRALLKQARRSGVEGSLAKAAERFLRRQTELEDTSPFEHAPAAKAEHAARLSEAQVALREDTALPRRGADLRAVGGLAFISCERFLQLTALLMKPGDFLLKPIVFGHVQEL